MRPFRISNLEGKKLIEKLWRAHCIFLLYQVPALLEGDAELYSYMKNENRLNQLLFVDSYVKAKGIEVNDKPDAKVITRFIDKLNIDPANVYFDTLGSLLKKFLRVGAFPKAKILKTKIIWPTILVISPTGKLVESIEGSRPDFIEILERHL